MPDIVSGRYEWNDKKADENLRKHHVSFEEAKTSFNDPRALVIPDRGQSERERFCLMGMSGQARLLFVVHAEKVVGPRGRTRVRIISARRATRAESYKYTSGDES